MRKIVLAFLIIIVSVSVSFGASTKISELPETQTLTDDDLFLVSTYATGSYTSKYITTQYVKSALGVMTIANDTLWDAAGDLVYGTGANTGSRLAIGAPYALLMTNAGATAPAWTYTLGATGTRLTKIWATDLELTNAPTIGGADWTTILQPLNDDLTALSSGGTANCIWGEKSDASGIECKTSLNLQLDDSAAQFKSATASKGTLKFDQTGISDTKLVTVKYTATDSYTYTPTLVGNVSHLIGTTWTNGKWCSYSTSTGLTCNEDAPTGSGDITAVGSCTSGSCATIGNANTSGGYIDFLEDSDNGTNYVRLKAPDSTGDATVTLPSATDTLVGKATTDTLTNKTLDVDGTGNVVKSWGYIVLTHPHLCAAGAPMQTTSTANTYGQCKFGNATDKATNYAEYYLTVPADIDTDVDLVGTFKFKLGGADTADHEYEISFDSVADSAAYAGSLGDAVSLAYTADASGADGDVETATGTLTGWKAAMTAGQLFVIRVARDGDHATDASTVDSYSGPLVIKYKITQ